MNATLTDDRVESMRSTVMNAVDTDIRRRGTRTRRVVGFAAASILVVGVGTAGLSAINMTDGGSDSSFSSADAGSAPKGIERDVSAGEAAGQSGGDTVSGLGAATAPEDREVITTGSVSVTVGNPRQSAQEVSSYVESIGGRVDSRSENTAEGFDTAAYLQVRVPSAKVTQTIAKLKTYGTVTNVSLQNEDVTTQTAGPGRSDRCVERLDQATAEDHGGDGLQR